MKKRFGLCKLNGKFCLVDLDNLQVYYGLWKIFKICFKYRNNYIITII